MINDNEYSVSHNFWGFVLNTLNIIDLAAIVPYYLDLLVGGTCEPGLRPSTLDPQTLPYHASVIR